MHQFLAAVWRMSGGCLAAVWRLSGGCGIMTVIIQEYYIRTLTLALRSARADRIVHKALSELVEHALNLCMIAVSVTLRVDHLNNAMQLHAGYHSKLIQTEDCFLNLSASVA